MKKSSPKILVFCVLSALLLTAISILPRALAGTGEATEPFSAGGAWESRLLNRVNLSVNCTQFVFLREDSDRCTLTFTLSAAKTEPDFYACLDSLTLSGLSYERMSITAGSENGDAVAIDGAVLPVGADALPQTLTWTAVVEFTVSHEVQTFTPTLRLGYTAGTKYELRDSYYADIPMTVRICDLSVLPTVMANAEKLFTYDLYTEESLAELRALLDGISQTLQNPGDISQQVIDGWIRSISDTIDALVLK